MILAITCTYFLTKVNTLVPVEKQGTSNVIVGKIEPRDEEKIVLCKKDKLCKLLAEVGYYEARNQKQDSDVAAVMHVVLNRAAHPKRWSNDPEKVVSKPWQFSYRWDGSMRYGFAEKKAHKRMMVIAYDVVSGKIESPVGLSDHYHTKDIKPNWDWKKLTKVAIAGDHIYYKHH